MWGPVDTSNPARTADLGRVIMLSGPIGSGKTTVARLLLPLLPTPTSYIEGDMFWAYIANGGVRTKRENFHTIMRSMTAAALPFARSGFTVLLDFSTPPHFLRTVRAILRDIPFDYAVIRPSIQTCAYRAAGRSEGTIDDYEPYRHFYSLFEGVQGAICDDLATPEEVAHHVHAGLSAGAFA
jgi:adenylylsulfate kinase-like enzyme